MVLTANDPRHGTPNGYNNQGCRCQPCRDAWNAYARPYQEAYRRRKGITPRRPGRTCGTVSAYNAGCRCQPCRDAASEHQRKMRARRKERLARLQEG